MYDLPDACIIIPVRIDQPQRLINLERNVKFLKAHLNTEIRIIEQDSQTRIPPSLESQFVRDGDTFHKTKLFNTTVKTTNKRVYFFLDVDVLVDPKAYVTAYESLISNKSDVCLLYTRNTSPYEYVEVPPSVLEEMSDPTGWFEKLSTLKGVQAPCEGGIVAFHRNTFISIGGFNERFIGYGSEDSEILVRAKRLGLRYEELPFSIYHQTHDRGYMHTGIPLDFISEHILSFTKSESIETIRKELCSSSIKYVTMKPSGGRLGNLLFEIAGLFQYAKMTQRVPFMTVPTKYSQFLSPLLQRMVEPPPGIASQLVQSNDTLDATFYTEIPLVFTETPVLKLSAGYLQSPELFRDVRWMFQDLLGSSEPSFPETDVLIHVRRGDYAHYPHVYEQLGDTYYTRAMKYMKTRIPDCRFIIVSDDIRAVRSYSYFQRDDVTFFDDSGMSDTSVLQHMSRFQSYILANSTFGVWGALLSKVAKTVIVPIHWSRTDTSSCLGFWNTIYSPEWIRISSHPITIQTSNPEFDIFKTDTSSDVAVLYNHIPNERPNARCVILITDDANRYTSNERPSIVDYIASTTYQHIGTIHPSWNQRPVAFVGNPNTLEHFHYIQCVAETLLTRPRISLLTMNVSNTRPGSIFQTLHSVYRQTQRTWEVLLTTQYGDCPVSHYLHRFLAFPNLLYVLPTSPTIFHTGTYARGTIVGFVLGGTLLTRNRLESQLSLLNRNSICSSYYIDEFGDTSIIPGMMGNRISTATDISKYRGTFLFYKELFNEAYWFHPNTPIRIVTNPTVRFYTDIYNWKRKTNDSAAQPITATPASSQAILISGLTNTNRSTFQLHGRGLEQVTRVKKLTGLKYIV